MKRKGLKLLIKSLMNLVLMLISLPKLISYLKEDGYDDSEIDLIMKIHEKDIKEEEEELENN
jgi:hypothetical protein